jgi:hypothetical protein
MMEGAVSWPHMPGLHKVGGKKSLVQSVFGQEYVIEPANSFSKAVNEEKLQT